MGHVVDPLEYNKAHYDRKWVRKEYTKALPFLNIMSSGRPFGQVDEDEIESLRRKVRELEKGRDDRIEDLEVKVAELTDMLRLIYERPEIVEKLK